MFYERKIRYFDQYRDGERISAGGFARTEVRDSSFKLEITAKCSKEVSGCFPVLAQTDEGTRRIGEIRLQDGTGNFRQTCHIGTGEDELPYFDMTGIQIPLSGTEELMSSWKRADGTAPAPQAAEHGREAAKGGQKAGRDVQAQAEESGQKAEHGRDVQESRQETVPQETKRMSDAREQAEKAQSAQEAERVCDVQERAEEGGQETKHGRDVQGRAEESGQETKHGRGVQERAEEGGREAKHGRDVQAQESGQETAAQEEAAQQAAKEQPPLLRLREDKWEQLCLIYPHIHPFRDEREYLSVGPADFVLLSEKSYRAANNSFLLHGYYSYQHLILTRVEKRGEILYYIGVPGSYYEKEKQVAVMFGFESFECEEEPARYGDFGYYMMKVCI